MFAKTLCSAYPQVHTDMHLKETLLFVVWQKLDELPGDV